MRKNVTALTALLAAIALGACGNEPKDSRDSASGSAPPATVTEAESAPPASDKISEDLKERPVIGKPTGSPPSKLESEDIVKGKGTVAKKGDTVSMQYVGVAFSTGEEFDASWDRDEPFEFTLGEGMVIEGWDEGIPGMREGGRRKLTIPADQAYGPQGSPPAIGPNETLIFVVDLVEVK